MHSIKMRLKSRSFFIAVALISLFFIHPSLTLAQFGNLVTTFNLPGDKFEVDSTNKRIYVSSSNTGNILVVDTNNLANTSTIYVGDNPIGMALSQDGSTLYVARSAVSLISVIDTETKTVVNEIQTPMPPYDIEVSADGRLFATPTTQGVGIMQLDATTGEVINNFALGVFIYQKGLLEISPDNNTLYFANVGLSPGTLAAYDISTIDPELIYKNPHGDLGSNGQDLVLTNDGQFISYAVGGGNDLYDIYKISTGDFTVAGSFSTGAYPREITYSPSGTTAYTVHTSGQIDVYNALDFSPLNPIPTSGEARELEVDSSGNHLFAAFSDSVRVYSLITTTNTPPELNIISPADGTSQTSSLVGLTGTATDAEDGEIHTNILWSSSIDGELGMGANLVVNLSAGQHIITANITDSAGATTTAQVSITISLYCDAYGLYTNYEWIESFMIDNNLFQSGNDLGYGDYTHIGMYLSKGSHSITLTPGFTFGAYNEFWRVWIDFNQNGVFETSEMIYSGSSNGTINSTFTVPDTALIGDTRMRVAMRWAVAPNACGSFSWGEVEDYTISVTN
ncbi:GEVED domain-containing protein [Kaarinaea lacus]